MLNEKSQEIENQLHKELLLKLSFDVDVLYNWVIALENELEELKNELKKKGDK